MGGPQCLKYQIPGACLKYSYCYLGVLLLLFIIMLFFFDSVIYIRISQGSATIRKLEVRYMLLTYTKIKFAAIFIVLRGF